MFLIGKTNKNNLLFQLESKKIPLIGGTSFFGKILNFGIKVVNAINDVTGGPTRTYNLGINTLAQVPVNAFGQHIDRHGFLPVRDDSNLYFKVAQHNNDEANNRLVRLKAKLLNGSVCGINVDDQKPAKVLILENVPVNARIPPGNAENPQELFPVVLVIHNPLLISFILF